MKRLLQLFCPIEWAYKPRGICPVQAEGYFMGYYFFFRGRWDYLTIDFAKSHEDWFRDKIVYWKVLKQTNGEYDAGYYPYDKCIDLIVKGCFLFFIYRILKIRL